MATQFFWGVGQVLTNMMAFGADLTGLAELVRRGDSIAARRGEDVLATSGR